ncbi:hypothetical protein M1523_03795 [Patescibacteria group bacterium]|nr:hypothetical protein [Patescibacteria group bacterium]MCL5091816.1 hypothetical protein [Patescibacteria group bacterium]
MTVPIQPQSFTPSPEASPIRSEAPPQAPDLSELRQRFSLAQANFDRAKDNLLAREFPLRQAEAQELRGVVGSPATEADILKIVSDFERGERVQADHPAVKEVRRRRNAGETMDQIKATAQETINKRTRANAILRVAMAMEKPTNAVPIIPGVTDEVKARIAAGESRESIMVAAQAAVDGYKRVDQQRQALAWTEARIAGIKQEQQRVIDARRQALGATDADQLGQIRTKLASTSGVSSLPQVTAKYPGKQ